MRKILLGLLLLSTKLFAQFTQGNLVIYRVGDGTKALTNAAAPVFLDEYTPTGQYVRSIPMPTIASGSNKPLTASGTAFTEGMINRSADQRSLILTGYAQNLGSTNEIAATSASEVNRVIGVVDYAGNINTTTSLSDYASGTNSVNSSPRSAISIDGTKFWLVGTTGGVRYTSLGAASSSPVSSTPANIRSINIFRNQLYVGVATTSTTRIATVGSGTPNSSGQTVTNLPGYPIAGGPGQFVFFDLDPAIPGVDVLYVADEDSTILKYSLDASSKQWMPKGAITGSHLDYYRGLTGVAVGNTVRLYAIRKGGTIRFGAGGELVTITDATGHNGTLSGTPIVIATAAANIGFRGIALAPQPISDIPLPIQFADVKAIQLNSNVQISFSNLTESDMDYYMIERSADGLHFEPVATLRPTYNNGGKADYSWIDKTPSSGAGHYRIKGTEKNGKELYSPVVKINRNTNNAILSIAPNPVLNRELTWQMNVEKGVYKVQVVNSVGHVLYKQTIAHAGGVINEVIHLPSTVTKGRYTLLIAGDRMQSNKSFIVL